MDNHAENFAYWIKQLPIGKKLPDAVYLHKSALQHSAPMLHGFCATVAKALKIEDTAWDLVKLHRKEFKVAFLSYPDFYTDSYPALKKSTLVDLSKLSTKETNYEDSENPPILHRKELMILESDPHHALFKEITEEGENAGLYENPFKIGFQQTWLRLISDKGYCLIDGRLVRSSSVALLDDIQQVHRHLTAITRYELSTPLKSLAKHGYLDGNHTIFDYGCGKGDDLRELEAHGLSAMGWDPNFRPDADITEADVVNIGFVINVIEDIDERIEALQKAYILANKILVVSAMVAGEATISKFKPYKDGILTSKNTFQKYYSQSELQSFIERTLEVDAIAVAPGIFYVFRDPIEQQSYLSERQRRHREWNHLSNRESRSKAAAVIFAKHQPLLQSFWSTCLELGRLPALDELEDPKALEEALGSPRKALQVLEATADIEDLKLASSLRTEDLLVYFALGLFGKRKPYTHMAEGMKRDIKAFFGTYQNAIENAKEALFSVSNVQLINELCEKSATELPACQLNTNHSLVFHERYLNQLAPELRIYVGCAAQLVGELEGIDLVKIHITSGKVSFMVYEEFDSSPLPKLVERIKVRMRDQDVDFFDYVEPYKPPLLYWKSRYIDESFEDHKKQLSFDKKLAATGIMKPDKEFGPMRSELDWQLRELGLEIRGYRLYKV
ncbi:DNA phosphorothioation-associated putative methyltransferase [Nitrincola alkalilacustris]|uniref:DNA phosphorothioation-associated putative methyltransferase n=1 Tax=Nitrincola alkalilacustris TaxID=1571224 RepID=UPI00124CEC34|nr:DNA phosphorothioation-associated putative methyltransferase [Nitrincola alkalilacustris]